MKITKPKKAKKKENATTKFTNIETNGLSRNNTVSIENKLE